MQEATRDTTPTTNPTKDNRPLTSGKTAVALLDTVAGLRQGAAEAQIHSRRVMLTGSAALLAGVTAFLAMAPAADSPDAELIALCDGSIEPNNTMGVDFAWILVKQLAVDVRS